MLTAYLLETNISELAHQKVNLLIEVGIYKYLTDWNLVRIKDQYLSQKGSRKLIHKFIVPC